jgi:hypothetical protein
MVDRAWCQAIIFRTVNNLEKDRRDGRTHLCVDKYMSEILVLLTWVASMIFCFEYQYELLHCKYYETRVKER